MDELWCGIMRRTSRDRHGLGQIMESDGEHGSGLGASRMSAIGNAKPWRQFVAGYRVPAGDKLVRLCMVLCGLAPLFVLMAVRGNGVVPEVWFASGCVALIALPLAVLVVRLDSAFKSDEPLVLVVGDVEDNRSHLISYLFATLLPFYRGPLSSPGDLVALLVALAFIIFLFWHLNLHYMNVALAVFGYRIYTVSPTGLENPYSSRQPMVLITRRKYLASGDRVRCYRLSETLRLELRP